MDNEVTVHIRSPSLNETLNVEISLNATVISLKKSIEAVHPNHPSASIQRIIFSGKLLQDTDTLIDVLKKVEDGVIPTFHLVVKPSLQAFQATSVSQQQQQPQPTNIPSASTTAPPQTEVPQQPIQNIAQNNIPGYPLLLPGGYQVVFINGQYYLAPVLTPSQAFSLPQTQTQAQQQPQNILQQFILPQQQQQQQQQQPQRQPFFGFNQFVDRQVNNVQRATSIWLALKLIVILFMLCQGASIERIFIFHTIAFVFFLYQTGRLRVVFRRVRVQDLNRPQGVFIAPPQQNNQPAEGTEQDSANTATEQPEQQRPARPLSTLDVVKRGIYAFFASLWPSYGVDPRIARAFENEDNNNNE